MHSNDEGLKEKVNTGQVTVNKAYEEVRKRETRVCKICGKEKRIIDFFGNDKMCKDCSQKESENKNPQKTIPSCNAEIEAAHKQVTPENKKENNTLNVHTPASNTPNFTNVTSNEQTKKICEFMKTERKGDYNYNIQLDINSLGYVFDESVERIRKAIFKNAELMKYATYEHCDAIISALYKAKEGLEDIIEKTEELRKR